jgi:hypothetical protein
MKKILSILGLSVLLTGLSSCDKYLDVNVNPANPEAVEAALLLAPMQAQFAEAIQWDARYIGAYVQNWQSFSAGNVWDLHGYVRNSDAGGQLWRNVYWKGGRNLVNLINDAQAGQKWDYLGVGKIMQAWGWQMLTDVHGDIIIKEAFDLDPNKNTFSYDSQEFAYQEVQRLCTEALTDLARTDGAVSATQLARGDLIYKGDRTKWVKFAYGLLALNMQHLSKKSALYNPDKVIEYVDKALASNADDAFVPFAGSATTDASFFAPQRNNLGVYGQSQYIVELMNGTRYPGVIDPRMPVMLQASPDGVYRGIALGAGQSTAIPAAQRVLNVWGLQLNTAPPAGTPGKYVFTNQGTQFPVMTYAQLQFVKAEAAFLKGDKALALDAYRKGIVAHLTYCGVPAAERDRYVASPLVVPASSALTLAQIMNQKYIAQWGWGFLEQWTDLRRYDYNADAFPNFQLPLLYFTDNNGKPVQRLRPRFNSEYLWNIEALTAVGGFDIDYHTKPMWFSQP